MSESTTHTDCLRATQPQLEILVRHSDEEFRYVPNVLGPVYRQEVDMTASAIHQTNDAEETKER